MRESINAALRFGSSALLVALLLFVAPQVAAEPTRSSLPETVGEAATHYIPGTAFVRKDRDKGHRYRFLGRELATAYSDRLRLGAEVELSKYETQLAGLPGIQIKSYNIRALLQIVPFPDQLSPYCGAGLGVDVMRFDDDMVESVISRYRVDKFGIAMGGVGFVGVQLPIAPEVTLFAEGRAAGAFHVFSPADVEMGAGIYDGYGGLAGLRMRF